MKAKKITFRQIRGPESGIRYQVTKAVDTMTPEVSTILTAAEVKRYCDNRRFNVTILPRRDR